MFALSKILANIDPEDARRYTLRELGLYETMCFTSSNSQELWSIEKNTLSYIAWDSDGLCEAASIYQLG